MENITMKIIKHDKELSEQDRKEIARIGEPDPTPPAISSYLDMSSFWSSQTFTNGKQDIDFGRDLYYDHDGGSDNYYYDIYITIDDIKYEAIFDKKEIEELSFLFEDNRINSFTEMLDEIEQYVDDHEIEEGHWLDINIKVDYKIGCEEFTLTLFNEEELPVPTPQRSGGFGTHSLNDLEDFMDINELIDDTYDTEGDNSVKTVNIVNTPENDSNNDNESSDNGSDNNESSDNGSDNNESSDNEEIEENALILARLENTEQREVNLSAKLDNFNNMQEQIATDLKLLVSPSSLLFNDVTISPLNDCWDNVLFKKPTQRVSIGHTPFSWQETPNSMYPGYNRNTRIVTANDFSI